MQHLSKFGRGRVISNFRDRRVSAVASLGGATLCLYPKWIIKACDRIDAKPDDSPLTNTETDALIRYLYGDEEIETT